jgi:hypothetical protein
MVNKGKASATMRLRSAVAANAFGLRIGFSEQNRTSRSALAAGKTRPH